MLQSLGSCTTWKSRGWNTVPDSECTQKNKIGSGYALKKGTPSRSILPWLFHSVQAQWFAKTFQETSLQKSEGRGSEFYDWFNFPRIIDLTRREKKLSSLPTPPPKKTSKPTNKFLPPSIRASFLYHINGCLTEAKCTAAYNSKSTHSA